MATGPIGSDVSGFAAAAVLGRRHARLLLEHSIDGALRRESRLGVMEVPEGGSTFNFTMSHILDGHTGIEHNVPVYPLFNDVLSLWGASTSGYTPTLIVHFGGLSGEFFW